MVLNDTEWYSVVISGIPLALFCKVVNTRPSKDTRTSGRSRCTSAAAGLRQETLKDKTHVIGLSRFNGGERIS